MEWSWKTKTRAVLTIALAAALGACGSDDDGGTGVDPSADGTYVLEEANGEALPVTALEWEDQSGTWEGRILSGGLVLSNGRYEAEFVVAILLKGTDSSTEFSFEDQGTYQVAGNRITFQPSSTGQPFDGTLSGDVLTVSQPIEDRGTFTGVFRR